MNLIRLRTANLPGLSLILLLSLVPHPTSLQAREWSEPVRLSHHGQVYGPEFDVGLDSRGVIHLVSASAYIDEESYRAMYQRFDCDGQTLGDQVPLFGDYHYQGFPKLVIDESDNIHIIGSVSTRFDIPDRFAAYLYTKFNAEGERVIEPVPIEGTTQDTVIWQNPYEYYYFRRSDGNFIFAGLPYHTFPGDDIASSIVGYLLFDSTGSLLIEPQLLWSERDYVGSGRTGFYNNQAYLDSQDNLHFIWRLVRLDQSNVTLYACVSSEYETLTEPIVIPQAFNPEGGGILGMVAFDLNSIYLGRIDVRRQGEPYRPYLQCISYDGRERWHSLLFETYQGSSVVKLADCLWGGQIYPIGFLRDSTGFYWHYYMSIDTTGQIVDSLEFIQRTRAQYISHLLRNQERIFAFYHDGISEISMVVGMDTLLSAPKELSHNIPQLVSIDVFPQPCNISSKISILGYPDKSQLSICNTNGRIIWRRKLIIPQSGQAIIDLNDILQIGGLSTGQYFILLNSSDGRFVQRKLTIIK